MIKQVILALLLLCNAAAYAQPDSKIEEKHEPLIEDVNARQLEKLISEEDYVAVFWCKCMSFSNVCVIQTSASFRGATVLLPHAVPSESGRHSTPVDSHIRQPFPPRIFSSSCLVWKPSLQRAVGPRSILNLTAAPQNGASFERPPPPPHFNSKNSGRSDDVISDLLNHLPPHLITVRSWITALLIQYDQNDQLASPPKVI